MLISNSKGQTFLEYTIMLGVLILIFFAVSPMMKRGIQAMIKVVADQVGIQTNAEQTFDDRGHMELFNATTAVRVDKITQAVVNTTTYIYDDATDTTSMTLMNLGFTEEN